MIRPIGPIGPVLNEPKERLKKTLLIPCVYAIINKVIIARIKVAILVVGN